MQTIVKMLFGSHVYGTNTPSSDHDYKAVHIPSARDIILQRVKPTYNLITKQDITKRNTAEDVDFESFSLQKYISMVCEGQTVVLSMLFTPDRFIQEKTELWEVIKNSRHRWINSGVSAFAGYCRQQANKYGIKGSRVAASRSILELLDTLSSNYSASTKLIDVWHFIEQFVALGQEHIAIVTVPAYGDRGEEIMLEVCNRKVQQKASLKMALSIYQKLFNEYGHRALLAEKNESVDWKAMMHAVRVCGEAEELLLRHNITYPRPDASVLLAIRKGELPYKQVAEMLENGLIRLEECQKLSTLPKEPDKQHADDLVFDKYKRSLDMHS